MESQQGTPQNGEGPRRRERVKKGLVTIGNALQKLNLAKRIGEMEKDQELADDLEVINQETAEEAERKKIVQEAVAKCQAEIEEHIQSFLFLNPEATYEEWINDLHPENVADGSLLPGFKEVDLRFYVEDSDHRILWNERVPDRQVPARTYQVPEGELETVDLLL